MAESPYAAPRAPLGEAELDARPTGRIGSAGVRRIARLVALYCAQGLPFGFATYFIPIALTNRSDFSYAKATVLSLAQLPWLMKLLWAPAADTHYLPRVGRRRTWILGAQALLLLTVLLFSGLDFDGPLLPIFLMCALTSLWASVQDTAVDALAMETLPPAERGLGNAAQVGGYKVGMVLGGSGLIFVGSALGSRAAMLAMALGVGLLMVAALLFREPPPPARAAALSEGKSSAAWGTLWRTLQGKGWVATLVFIATVKVGETSVNAILKPYLKLEQGFGEREIAVAIGVVATSLSLLGSVVGGASAGRISRLRALVLFAAFQAITLCALGAGLWFGLGHDAIVALVSVEHFAAGMLTPALFAYMMDISEPEIAATHYSLLATVELVAKGLGGVLAGPLADRMGASPFIVAAGAAGALPLLLVPLLRRPPQPHTVVDRA